MCTIMESRCKELGLHVMVSNNTDQWRLLFCLCRFEGKGNGYFCFRSCKTVLSLVDSTTKPHDLARPGHIFPLIAKQGGV
jgi:3,4-dihydroxy 2-butanone 4-phosphate synthase/GTP cyclohydrolase II